MYFSKTNQCCGIAEFSGLGNHQPTEIIKYICERTQAVGESSSHLTKHNYGIVIFTDDNHHSGNNFKRLQAIMDFIAKHGLGITTLTPQTRNWNTTNNIKLVAWNIDITAMKKWFNALPKPEPVLVPKPITCIHCGYNVATCMHAIQNGFNMTYTQGHGVGLVNNSTGG